jgi:hypothetical protein
VQTRPAHGFERLNGVRRKPARAGNPLIGEFHFFWRFPDLREVSPIETIENWSLKIGYLSSALSSNNQWQIFNDQFSIENSAILKYDFADSSYPRK